MKNFVNSHIVSIFDDLPSGGAKRLFKANLMKLKGLYYIRYFTDRAETNKIQGIVSYYIYILKYCFIKPKYLNEINRSNLLLAYQSWATHAPTILRHVKIPTIYICHEPPREYYDKEYRAMFSFKEKIINSVGFIVKIVDKWNISKNKNLTIVANSKFSQAAILDAYNLYSMVVYPGIDIKKFSGKVPYKRRVNQAISVGAINKLKNQKFILECLTKINIIKRPKIIFVGNGADKNYVMELRAYAKKNMIDMSIRINISDQDLYYLYSKSKLFIYSSINEPFGLAVLEAMASGLPVIAPNKGGFSEVVNNKNGYIFDNKNPYIWADKIERILHNQKKWEMISKNNLATIKNFSLDKMNDSLTEIINQKIINL